MNFPMLQPSRAPGREGQAAPPAPEAPAAPVEGQAPAEGQAPPPGDGLFGGLGMMLPMILIIFVMFFFMNRSEKKRRTELESKLKKGDRVLTRSGFIGKLVEIGETRARVELAPGVVVPIVKTAIEGLADAEEGGKGSDKASDKAKDTDADDKKKKKK